MDKQKTGTLETVKQHVDAAFAALCKISVYGPAAIPYAKAVQELAAAGVELKNMMGEKEPGKPTDQTEDGGGEP